MFMAFTSGPVTGALAAWLALAAILGGGGEGETAPRGEVPAVAVEQVTEIELATYQWQNRLVLIFAPTATDTAYAQQSTAFASRESEIVDRDLLIGYFPVSGPGALADRQIAPTATARLRQQLGVADDQFTILLIGKDGGVKRRSAEPLTAEQIFATIDSMPMRQREQR